MAAGCNGDGGKFKRLRTMETVDPPPTPATTAPTPPAATTAPTTPPPPPPEPMTPPDFVARIPPDVGARIPRTPEELDADSQRVNVDDGDWQLVVAEGCQTDGRTRRTRGRYA